MNECVNPYFQATCNALKEADNWTTLTTEIEDDLDGGDLQVVATKLTAIQVCNLLRLFLKNMVLCTQLLISNNISLKHRFSFVLNFLFYGYLQITVFHICVFLIYMHKTPSGVEKPINFS